MKIKLKKYKNLIKKLIKIIDIYIINKINHAFLGVVKALSILGKILA